MPASKDLYRTQTLLERVLRVVYPAGSGRIVLRTELDWGSDLEPFEVSPDGTTSTFKVRAHHPFLYFKVCLRQGDTLHWSKGGNKLLVLTEEDRRAVFPYFFAPEEGHFSQLLRFDSQILKREHRVRVFLPPGYDENTLSEYPVAFLQDGQNLFFPQEAFMGQDWKFGETSSLLRSMGAVDDALLVGIYSADRMQEYTQPGYESYARSLAEEILPQVEGRLRASRDRRRRVVWGSSLGGVVSFYTAWQYPHLFGGAACMSSTFSFRDDLMERVLNEPPPEVGFYLDSGWPGDNYETTLGMAMALISRGWVFGHNLIHLAFPMAEHSESAWGTRLHVPLQFLFGAVARASRLRNPVFRGG